MSKQVVWKKFKPPKIVGLSDMEDPAIAGQEQENFSVAYENFKLYEIHTNFYVTAAIAEAIEMTDGIEIMKAISPYRVIVGVGKLFKTAETKVRVLNSINDSLGRTVKHECSSSESDHEED